LAVPDPLGAHAGDAPEDRGRKTDRALASTLLSPPRMDANLGTHLPGMIGVAPNLSLDLHSALVPLLSFLVWVVGFGVALLLITACRTAAPAFGELVGRLTMGTFAEPVGALVLDGLAALAAARWYVADVLLAWRAALAAEGDAVSPPTERSVPQLEQPTDGLAAAA
jgi:hypothetical protein